MQTQGKPPSVRVMENRISDLEAEIERLRAALREYTCTGTDHPCGCYDQFLNEKAEIDRLRAALKECADDLEASVNAEYAGTLDYPSRAIKHELDMEPVRKARELLTERQ